MTRCKYCDYSVATNKQSSYFESLPDAERKRHRKVVYVDGQPVVTCVECAPERHKDAVVSTKRTE